MRSVLCRHLLIGLLIGAASWAAPAFAQAGGHLDATAPAPEALANAKRFAALCETKLQLSPAQTAALHTYLDQEVTYLGVLAVNGLAAETPAPAEAELGQVLARLLSPTQLRQFQQLVQQPQAQSYLRSMALLPSEAAGAPTKQNKHNKKRTARMMAQRLDEAD